MRRRAFIAGLGAMAAWPHMGQAQLRSKPHRIGFLSQQPGQPSLFSRTFIEGLRDLGYVDGQNITTERRRTPARAHLTRWPAELARMNLAAVVTRGWPAGRAAPPGGRSRPGPPHRRGDPRGARPGPSRKVAGGWDGGAPIGATPDAARPPLPPFTADTAAQKVRMAEDAWNSRDPERVSLA